MKPGTLVVAVIAGFVGLSAAAAEDEKVDKAIKELDQRFAKVKSYTAKIESKSDVEFGPGHTRKWEMAGTTEWLRKGEKALTRSEMKDKTTETEEGKTTTTPSTMLAVDDGEFCYMLTEEKDEKTVVKNWSLAAKIHQPAAFFEPYKGYYDIKLLDDDKVEGDDCYVFELKMKPMEGVDPSGPQVVYYQKKHGIQVKFEIFDVDGKKTTWSISKDLKVNVDISADRFKFKIPEGAEVRDATEMQQPVEKESEPEEKEEEKKEKKKGIKLPKWP